MTFDEIIEHYKDQGSGPLNKGLSAASRGLGYQRNTLYNWRDNGVPIRTQQVIAAKTGLPVREEDTKPTKRRRAKRGA